MKLYPIETGYSTITFFIFTSRPKRWKLRVCYWISVDFLQDCHDFQKYHSTLHSLHKGNEPTGFTQRIQFYDYVVHRLQCTQFPFIKFQKHTTQILSENRAVTTWNKKRFSLRTESVKMIPLEQHKIFSTRKLEKPRLLTVRQDLREEPQNSSLKPLHQKRYCALRGNIIMTQTQQWLAYTNMTFV